MPWSTLRETLEIDTPESVGVASNRWACQIEGTTERLGALGIALNTLNNTRALRLGSFSGVALLTTPEWDAVEQPEQIQALADAALNDCIGCLNLLGGTVEANVGTIYENLGNGRSVMTRFSPVNIKIGPPLDTAKVPIAFVQLLNLSTTDPWLGDCLPLYYKEPDFYTVYKAVEAIMQFCGGEHAMRKRTDFDGARLSKIKNVADYHRHIQKPNRVRPNPFYSLDECVGAVTEAIAKLAASRIHG